MGLFIYILFLHFLADFVFQTDEMAKNKSTSWLWLMYHVGTYEIVFILGLLATTLFPLHAILSYVFFNGGIHFLIDAITSRITSKLYKQGKIHEFFVVIGFDQFLHATTLLLTLQRYLR